MKELQEKHPGEFCYAVYNGIGISDIVVLWRIKDLHRAISLISGIEYDGVARKTITTLGFPMKNTDGTIEDYIFSNLQTCSGQEITLSIRGSIRSMSAFIEFRKLLATAIGTLPPVASSWNLGKYDFTISTKIPLCSIEKLLQMYYNHNRTITQACWEIYTDFMDTNETDKFLSGTSIPPRDILAVTYHNFQKIYRNEALKLQKYPWSTAMLELLGTHYYIDRHPILHGPSYLIYHSLRIANAYLSGQITDFTDSDKRHDMLHQSEDNITYFLGKWDQLTEQITRNDDAMLNNRNNTHTLHFSLPESALDFYHAFLRRIVNYLVEYDKCADRVPDNFEFDFLLSPTPISRFRFSSMLNTDHRFQTNDTKIWPEKQAYILDLPLKSVFKPMDVFIPVVHECFHCFGDELRQRKVRKNHMILFVATCIATSMNCGTERYSDLVAHLARQIRNNIRSTNEPHPGEPYLEETIEQLRKSTYDIMNLNGLDCLFKKMGGDAYFLYSDRVLNQWNTVGEQLPTAKKYRSSFHQTSINSIVEACHVYFKECYADAMTIALLDLRPEEYLQRAHDEIQHFTTYSKYASQEQIAYENSAMRSLAQRFAIVLAACCGGDPSFRSRFKCKHSPQFTPEECVRAIKAFSNEHPQFSRALAEYFVPLIRQNAQPPASVSAIPPAALYQVVEYLITSMDLLFSKQPTYIVRKEDLLRLTPAKTYNLDKLVKDFNDIIRDGNMFANRFYELIYEHHDDIWATAKKDRDAYTQII